MTLTLKIALSALALLSAAIPATAKSTALSNDAVATILIKESRDQYDGPCACPYDHARNGSSCGKRSAYSRPGGEEPLCYRSDVTPEMIEQYRRK